MNLNAYRKPSGAIAGTALVAGVLAGANGLENRLNTLILGNKQSRAEKGESSVRQAQLDAIVNSENYGLQVKALYSDNEMVREAIRAISEQLTDNYFKGLNLKTKEGRKESARKLVMLFENFKVGSFFDNSSSEQIERWITKSWVRDAETARRLKPHMAEALGNYFRGQFSDYGAVCIPGNNNGHPAYLLVSDSLFRNPSTPLRQALNSAVQRYNNFRLLYGQ